MVELAVLFLDGDVSLELVVLDAKVSDLLVKF